MNDLFIFLFSLDFIYSMSSVPKKSVPSWLQVIKYLKRNDSSPIVLIYCTSSS